MKLLKTTTLALATAASLGAFALSAQPAAAHGWHHGHHRHWHHGWRHRGWYRYGYYGYSRCVVRYRPWGPERVCYY